MTKWVENLLKWFEVYRRPMPWRDDPSPYRVWVSEIMLQQTQVATVIPFFERFTARFPTVEALAVADVQDVLKLWEGLGYYSRARNLLRAAQVVMDDLAGTLPTTYAGWKALPGVGDYTAAAVSSIAHGEAMPSVDGNVLRVFSRFWGITDDVMLPATRNAIREKLRPHIRKADPSAFNQAMMELGALVCRPRLPDCGACPLSPRCVARCRGLTATLPHKRRPGKVPHYTEVVAMIHHRGKMLICRRHERGLLGGLWEFPAGRRQKKEGLRQLLEESVMAQTGLAIKDLKKRGVVTHAFSHFKVTLHVYACGVAKGKATARAHDDVRWVTPTELQALPLSTAQRKVAAL